MSLVNTNSPGAARQRARRGVAEALNLLGKKQALDDEAKDLAALIVFLLRAIAANIESSATVWDGRGYYQRADELRRDWAWTTRYAERLGPLIRGGDWARLPLVLGELTPHFADVRVAKVTRSAALWDGAYARLMAE